MKFRFSFFSSLLILLGLWVSPGAAIEEINYTSLYGFDSDVVGVGVDVVGALDDVINFTFVDDGGYLDIKSLEEDFGSYFFRVLSAQDSKISVWKNGVVSYADFFALDNGKYILNGKNIDLQIGDHLRYRFDEKKIRIDLGEPRRIDELNLPDGIDFEINGLDNDLGEGMILNSGKINFRDGEMFIEDRESVEINNVEINSVFGRVYLNPSSDALESYVRFGENEFSAGGVVGMSFKKGNEYAKIEEGDVFDIEISGGRDNKVVLEKGKNGNIPSLTLHGAGSITQDSRVIFVDESEKRISFLRRSFATSSPMQIFFKDKEGNPILDYDKLAYNPMGPLKKIDDEDLSEYEMLVDNYNRFVFVPSGNNGDFVAKYDGIDVKFSPRVSYNYVTEEEVDLLTGGKINKDWDGKDYEISGKHFIVNLSEGKVSYMLGRTRDYWNSLTDDMKNSVDSINFMDRKFITDTSSELTYAFYYPSLNSVYFYPGQMEESESFSAGAFRHEISHALTYKYINEYKDKRIFELEEKVGRKYEEILDNINRLKKEISEKRELLKSEDLDDLQKEEILRVKNSLEEEFEREIEVIDPFYDILYVEEPDIEKEWKGDDYRFGGTGLIGDGGPKDIDVNLKMGFARAYGRTNWLEDVATYVEGINDYPDKIREYANPKSKNYNPEVERKINLIYKYGMISKDDYNKIFGDKNEN